MLLLGLVGATFVVRWFGLAFAVVMFAVLGMVQFQSSYYLNRLVESDIRATVLSFRGLAINLGLGVASLFYTALVATLRAEGAGETEDAIFASALPAFPVYFAVLFALLLLGARYLIKDRSAISLSSMRGRRSSADEGEETDEAH
jgi:hypothetical protein